MKFLAIRMIFALTIIAALQVASLHVGAKPGKTDKVDEPKRLALDDAAEIVRQHLKRDKDRKVPLKELTTDDIWKKLKVQVFQIKYTDDLPNHASFVIKDKKVIPIGRDFGGDGVTSVCAAELADKKAYLVYSFAWGSGIHRSQLAALDVSAKESKEVIAAQSLVMDFKHDWQVKAVDAKTVRVEGGGVNFGNLELTVKDGKSSLTLRLHKDLPDALRRNVSTAE